MFNTILNEPIVQARIVNTQTVDFNDWCLRMANGSTVMAADVAAVMQQIEDKLPEVLSLNAKAICSPGGLIFRPKVSGSITQSQLKAKLEARKAAETDPEKAAKIDVNRELTTGDLAISDCEVSIEVVLPKFWSESFKKRASLKRVKSSSTDATDESDENDSGSSGNDNLNDNQNGNNGQQAVSAPTISGTTPFSDSTQMTISGPTGATIYYTTDGSTPTSSSTQYSSAVTLSATTTVKAIAIKDGVSSSVATKVFTKSQGGGGNSGDGGDGME